MDVIAYKDYNERTADEQYQQLLRRILLEGERVRTRQGVDALTLMQQTSQYDLSNGFPVITERDIGGFWKKAIGELCAFINGARTLDELKSFGCDWWDAWATEEKSRSRGLKPGDLGPGSYGGAFHDFPAPPGREPMDQFKHLVEQLIELPELRTHFVSPWIPQYQVRGQGKTPGTTIAPCHGWVHVRVINEVLHLHMIQRAADVPVGVPANMIQYASLAVMLGHLTGMKAGVFYHTMSDAHIYVDQLASVERIIEREPRRLPTVTLTAAGRAVTDIHDFRGEHFQLSDYNPHPGISRIPVAS